MSSSTAGLVIRDACIAGLQPDPDLTVSQWADEYRMLSQKSSAEAGRWRTDRTPYLREIMDALSPSSPIQRIVFMKGSQVGGSECGFNWLGYIMHMSPGPTMMVQPSIETAERVSKQRIQPMLEDTPVLAERVAPARERDSGNSLLLKQFIGGVLIISGANSAASLRSMPIRFLFCDEVDGYAPDVDDEGDPVSLAEKRTQTFSRKKIFLNSTPTNKGSSRIEAEFEISDQRRFFIPCPHCTHMQYLKWRNIKWDEDKPETAGLMCEGCGEIIEERFKTQMFERGEWRATAPGDGETVGFHLSSLYSPLGWRSWGSIVKEFLKAKTDAPLLKTWVNTVLGETFEEEYTAKVGAEALVQRVEFYDSKIVPEAAVVLTAGIDVQDNRLAIKIEAWGPEEESWVYSYEEIFGDPERPELWAQLDLVLFTPLKHATGKEIKIHASALDTGGHHTHAVYQYVRERRHKGVIAVKGQSQRGKPAIGKPVKVDVNFRGKSLKNGVELYPVGTDTVKSIIYGRLKHNEPGPGYVHFHADLENEFFKMLTVEKQVVRYVKGFPVREWVKPANARNEALDCSVYSYSALQWLYTKYNRKTFWEQFKRALANSREINKEKEQSLLKQDIAPTIKSRGKGFVQKW
jgi:phage terminase large subunit GpA-like protein